MKVTCGQGLAMDLKLLFDFLQDQSKKGEAAHLVANPDSKKPTCFFVDFEKDDLDTSIFFREENDCLYVCEE